MPYDGEQCASLVYRVEWGWWEYAADYCTDPGGEIAAMRRAESLESAWGLAFSVAERYSATGHLTAYVIGTHGDPRPLAIRI